MSLQTVQVQADTVDEAKQLLKGKIPLGYEVFSEEVSSDEKPKTIRASGETVDAALANAERELPPDAQVTARRELSGPTTRRLTVEAFDEQQARAKVTSQLGDLVTVKSLTLIQAERKGSLSIDGKPQSYQVEVVQVANVEIIYKTKARVTAHIGTPEDRIVSMAEALAGGWPPELNRESFEQVDLNTLVARLKHYQEMPHPSSAVEQTFGYVAYPQYEIVDGKIHRFSNSMEDAKLITTAAFLTGRGSVSLTDERISRFALDVIEHYAGARLAQFLFTLPRAFEMARLQYRSVVIEEHMIEVQKGVENVLFEIYEELGQGQVFTDQTVIQKLLSIVNG